MCDDCLEGTAAIGDFLIQDEEIEFQVLEFMTLLCTDEATFDTCVSNIVLVKKIFEAYLLGDSFSKQFCSEQAFSHNYLEAFSGEIVGRRRTAKQSFL